MTFSVSEASLTGAFRLIITLLVIYSLYSLLTRYIIPALMRKYVKDFQEKFYNENPHLRQTPENKKTGKITMDKADSPGSRFARESSEFIDYEEIKDK